MPGLNLGLVGAGMAAGANEGMQQVLARRILERKIAEDLKQQQFDNQSRTRQLDQGDRRITFAEEMARTPQPKGPMSMSPGGALVDPNTGRIITQIPERPDKPQGPVSMSPGGSLVDPTTGRVITSIPAAPKEDGFANWKQQYDYELAHPKKPAPEGGISPYQAERATRNLQSVDELSKKVNRWTTGVGSLLGNIPETDARNFAAELDTLKANIAFGELTAMREASKTGGALGQVSDREGQLLQAALGALDAGQSPANLKAQLQKVKASIQRWQAAQRGMAPAVSHGAPSPTAGGSVTEFDWVNGQLVPRQ